MDELQEGMRCEAHESADVRGERKVEVDDCGRLGCQLASLVVHGPRVGSSATQAGCDAAGTAANFQKECASRCQCDPPALPLPLLWRGCACWTLCC